MQNSPKSMIFTTKYSVELNTQAIVFFWSQYDGANIMVGAKTKKPN